MQSFCPLNRFATTAGYFLVTLRVAPFNFKVEFDSDFAQFSLSSLPRRSRIRRMSRTVTRREFVSAALTGAAIAAAAPAGLSRVQTKSANLLFILADDLGYGDFELLRSS